MPEGCTAQSEYQVTCDNYSMTWLYMTASMFDQHLPDQFIDQMAAQVKIIKKDSINCYLLGVAAKGCLISFKKGTGKAFQVIAYGIVNHQPVLVQLLLDKEPIKNEDIPEFPGHFIQLTKIK